MAQRVKDTVIGKAIKQDIGLFITVWMDSLEDQNTARNVGQKTPLKDTIGPMRAGSTKIPTIICDSVADVTRDGTQNVPRSPNGRLQDSLDTRPRSVVQCR